MAALINPRIKMAAHLNLKSNKKDKNNAAKLHWMPCVIKTDRDAKVSEYFEPIITERKDGGKNKSAFVTVLQGSFRGHPLLGKEIKLPENYRGVVLEEKNVKLNPEADRDLYESHFFDKFIHWDWDVEPSSNDKINMALEWLDVAEALHSPVDS